MKIDELVYEHFYNILIDHFREMEIPKEKIGRLMLRSPKIWEIEDENDRPYSFRIIQLFSSEPTIYNRIKSEAKDGFCRIKDTLLIAALNYIGINLPVECSGKIISDADQAKILFQLFLEKHFIHYLKENTQYLVYDANRNTIGGQNETQFLDCDKQQYIKLAEYHSDNSKIENEIAKVVNDYFQAISDSEFGYARSLLSSDFKGIIDSNYDAYVFVRSGNRKIDKINIWDIKIRNHTATCRVFYEESSSTHGIKSLYIRRDINLARHDKFNKSLKKLYDGVSIEVQQKLAGIEIYRLLNADSGRYLEFVSDEVTGWDILTPPRITTINYVSEIKFQYINNKWLLSGLINIMQS